ncbi:MAG: glycine zipper family protein [Gammaproteobacteria bacterium]|nr:glycine zipper family protein [Gammaproteobacteria bacterium]
MRTHKAVLGAAIGMLLAGCASIPTGPTVAVMPGPGKPFEQFRQDDAVCREFARQQLGVEPSKVAQQQVLSGAVAGAAIGAASGALLGHGQEAVGTGAGAGLLLGSAAGAGAADQSTMDLQYRYNISYEQCMYAKGNLIPGYPAPRYYAPPPPPPPPQ